jgi:hypothetical protein
VINFRVWNGSKAVGLQVWWISQPRWLTQAWRHYLDAPHSLTRGLCQPLCINSLVWDLSEDRNRDSEVKMHAYPLPAFCCVLANLWLEVSFSALISLNYLCLSRVEGTSGGSGRAQPPQHHSSCGPIQLSSFPLQWASHKALPKPTWISVISKKNDNEWCEVGGNLPEET